MERRVLLAVFLSFIVLYAYQAFFLPRPVEPEAQQGTPGSSGSDPRGSEDPRLQPPEGTRPPAGAGLQTRADVAEQTRADEPEALVGEREEREIVLETDTMRAVFTNRGGRLKQWSLKKYYDDAGRPVNLVPTNMPADMPLPFSLRVDEGTATPTLNNALYRAAPADRRVTFEYQNAAGLHVRKEFRIEPPYIVTFAVSVRQDERVMNPYVQLGPGLGDIGAAIGGGSFFTGNYVQPPQAIFHTGEDVERIPADSVAEQPVQEGGFRFAGVDDHYFIAAVVNPGHTRVEYRAVTLPPAAEGAPERRLLAHTYRFSQPPSGVKYYVGPKAFDELKAVDGELVRAIHFGVFAWLAVPLLGALKWIYAYVGNYGWAIIMLTVLINIAIFPLRHKSVVSMRKMQELQPQLKAIQERYADLKVTDPARQKMNTEIMNLYREKGVNPASGCVPMLLTLPVLFAFYSLLSQAIELRGAEFGWWIKDLSKQDPYYVTPVLMAASMFWQQKITPTSADPTQQRIMLMMPLMFSVLLMFSPSGLVIYWLVSNLWAIGQQYFTNWLIGPPVVHTVRPPAERRLKQAGAGRTERADKKS